MNEILNLINEMSPYLLLGFLLAGIMKAFIPTFLYRKYLAKNNFKSVINATMIGIPLPLCSCGVLPTAMGLHRQGASKSATVSFLIATPQTGVDSMIATYSLMGLPFAIIRPLAAIVTSIFGGIMVNWFGEKPCISDLNINKSEYIDKENNDLSFKDKCIVALKFAFVDMIQDIGKWLILGLIIAGLITVFVPESFFAIFSDNTILSILLVLVFAVPMYLCATGSIPIAVALMLKGLSPGTALVLLMAGPAINAASILVISKILGKRTMTIYLFSIILGAIIFALSIDYLLPREWFIAATEQIKQCSDHSIAIFNLICSIILITLLINAYILKYKNKSSCSCHSTNQHSSECDNCSCETDKAQINMTKIIIEGMNCNHCKANAEKAIMSVNGVNNVVADLRSGEAIISGNFDINEIINAVESIGFKVKR